MRDYKDDIKKVGRNMRTVRENIGYSQEKFADVLDIDRSYYAKIERGQVNPSLCMLLHIAEKMEINIKDFFKGI